MKITWEAKWYFSEMPILATIYIILTSILKLLLSRSLTDKNLSHLSIKQAQELKVQPSVNSPMKDSIEAGEEVDVLGVYGGFYLVNYKGVEGWITKRV